MNNPCPHCNGECCSLEKREGTIRYAQLLKHGEGIHWCKHCDDGNAIINNKSKVCSCYECIRHGCPCTMENTNDPSLDGTDLAHPAWWRGNDAGVMATAEMINEILNYIEAGVDDNGRFNNDYLNRLKHRLYGMYRK